MRIELRGASAGATNGLRSYADRRLRYALSRFAPRIGRVVVRLAEAGPGIDKECRVRIRLLPHGELFARDGDVEWQAAINRAAGRVERAMARFVDRQLRLGRRESTAGERDRGTQLARSARRQ